MYFIFKNFKLIGILLLAFLFTGCFSIPGYVNDDGSITPPYSKEVIVESLDGTISISAVETSKGITNLNPAKSDLMKSKKQETVLLLAGNDYYYSLEGNHSVVLAFRTLEKEATFRISYKGKVTECTIHNTDIGEKLIYIENY